MTIFSDEIVIESVMQRKFLYTADKGKRIKSVFKKYGSKLRKLDQNQLIVFFYHWGCIKGELKGKYSSNDDVELIYRFKNMDNNKQEILKTIAEKFYKASIEMPKPIKLAVVNKK